MGSGRTNQPQALVRKAGALPCTVWPWRLSIETTRDSDKHSTHHLGLATDLAGMCHSGHGRNTRIHSLVPFRHSSLRGETVSVLSVGSRDTAGCFGKAD